MVKKTVLGACPHDCPDTCSMIVNVEDGKVVGVRGNPDHPFTRGRLCVKVNNYEERVHSEDRLLYPLRRVGRKGAGSFERITWEEALATIGSRWRDIIAEHGASAILPYSYLGTEGILNGLNVGDPFFNKLGATVGERTFCDSGATTAYAMTIGDSAAFDPESIVHSKYIILWACNTLSTNSHHWPFIAEARKRGARIVVIDPVRTRTAKQADWHISIRPGTDGALALGLMNVIVDEGLTDDDYIQNYTVGFSELKERLKDYPPSTVSEITGVAEADIRRLAREFACSQPSAIRIGVAIERHAGGGQTVRALACLPALVGSWRQPGGGLLQLPIWAFPVNWPHLMRADFIQGTPRVLNLWKLGQALTGVLGLDPPIKSLVVYNANPVVTTPEQATVIAGLEREDLFTVVSEQFLTDTARYADIVLPATTQVEQEDIMFSWGHFYLSYNNQAIPPLGEAVSNTELFRRLAKEMDFDDPYFRRPDAQMIEESLVWDHPYLDGITLDELRRKGYMRLNLPAPENYAPHAQGGFHTPSGKCEFKSSLAENGNFVVPLFRQGYDGQQLGDHVDPLPRFIPPRESRGSAPELAQHYPISLISPKSHAFITSNYGNLSRQVRNMGEQSILMHPKDAEARNIISGQKVRVRSRHGEFLAYAKVTDDVLEGVSASPVGHWRSGDLDNRTVQSALCSVFADLGGAPTFSDILVEIEAAESALAAT